MKRHAVEVTVPEVPPYAKQMANHLRWSRKSSPRGNRRVGVGNNGEWHFHGVLLFYYCVNCEISCHATAAPTRSHTLKVIQARQRDRLTIMFCSSAQVVLRHGWRQQILCTRTNIAAKSFVVMSCAGRLLLDAWRWAAHPIVNRGAHLPFAGLWGKLERAANGRVAAHLWYQADCFLGGPWGKALPVMLRRVLTGMLQILNLTSITVPRGASAPSPTAHFR
jgi:hypothetical protein